MPRPGSDRIPEKAKDFKGSMIRLLKNLNKWKYIMLLALVVAFISAILALIAPKKLSQFADTISEGLVPNTEKLIEIKQIIDNNLYSEETLGRLQKLTIDLTQEEEILVYNAIQSKDEMPFLPNKVLEIILECFLGEGWDNE